MSRSRSISRSSMNSSQSAKLIPFRTISRNRSTHEIIKKTIDQDTMSHAEPTQSRLEQMLSLTHNFPKRNSSRSSVRSVTKLGRQAESARQRLLETSPNHKNNINTNRQTSTKVKNQSLLAEQHHRKSSSSISKLVSSPSPPSNQPTSRLLSKPIFSDMENDLEAIEQRLNELVNKKLLLMRQHLSSKNHMNRPLYAMKSVAIDLDLKEMLAKIQSIKQNKSTIEEKDILLDKKLAYIQTLLAQSTTESDLMKKHYFGLNANRRHSISRTTEPIKDNLISACKKLSAFEKEQQKLKKSVSIKKQQAKIELSTENRKSFKVPNPEDYEGFRYRHKIPQLNLQPLPRSTYKRDYLILKSEPGQKPSAKDNSIFPSHLFQMASIYHKDFKTVKTQITDHKELDAYRDKFKVLKVSYMPRKRMQTTMAPNMERRNLNIDPIKTDTLPKTIKLGIKNSETQSRFSKHMMISQARREFVWGSKMDKSRIKHQQLKNLQYHLKNIYKS